MGNYTVSNVLRELYTQRTQRNPQYSLRAFARDVSLSPGYLSRVFNGKKALSFERALELGRSLRLDENAERKLLKAAALETVRDPVCRRFLQTTWKNNEEIQDDEFQVLELDRCRFFADWYHIAILDLTMVDGFQSDAKWVGDQLGITPIEVQNAVDRLQRLGVLEIKDGVWRKVKKNLVIPTNKSDASVREHHKQMMDQAIKAMERTEEGEFEGRKIVGSTLAIDSKKIPQARALIEKFRRDIFEFLSKGTPEELYQLNIQFFRLTKKRLTRNNPK